MPLNWPTLEELPSVQAALAWLLAVPESRNDDIIAVARLKGLVLAENVAHWKVDDTLVTSLTEDGLGRLPNDPDRLGEILHGIGEMAARSHAPTLDTPM